jgi:histidinol phosphatase-like enzyme
MILTAADELGIDLRVSAAVGDMARDAEAALAAGIPPDRVCLVESPKAQPANTGAPATRHPLGVCRVSDLSAFADLLLMS